MKVLSTSCSFFLTLGESLFASTVVDIRRYLKKNCRIYNYYGPTECTEAAIEYLITEDDLVNRSVPLGRPMTNVHIYLFDKFLQHVVPNMHVGEIVIGGELFSRKRNQIDMSDWFS